jgi:hypothetical protein
MTAAAFAAASLDIMVGDWITQPYRLPSAIGFFAVLYAVLLCCILVSWPLPGLWQTDAEPEAVSG